MTKLIEGVGFNSRGEYLSASNGKIHKSYGAWRAMLQRCYCPKKHLTRPTYKDCTVADEWLDYQNFAEWYYGHEYSGMGYDLDKDLLMPNNKVYNPENCCFVPPQINSLLTDRKAGRGGLPIGVCYKKKNNRYEAGLSYRKSRKHLGYFDCPQEAHLVYVKAKEEYVKEMALEWKDRIADNVFEALMNWTVVNDLEQTA